MPSSKGRKKSAKKTTWRGRAEGSSPADGGAALPGFDVDALAESLSEHKDSPRALYTDDKLGSHLIRRGWVPVHIHFGDLSDMWVWPASAPDDEGWVPTMITVQEDGYIMQSADYAERQVDHALHYDARAEVLANIESIETYRHPSDPRAR